MGIKMRSNPSENVNLTLMLLITLFVGLVYAYIITNGDMNLFTKEIMGVHYTNSWDNLLKGRYDLDRSILGGEVYYRNEKAYMYFGLFPSLLRGFIELFFKRGDTDWSRISVLIAAILIFVSCTTAYYKMTLKVKSPRAVGYFYTVLFGLTIAFGSPVMHLLSSAFIYHEAIIWGLSWSCVFIWAFVTLTCSKSLDAKILFVLSISAGFALLSRTSFGTIIIAHCILVLIIIANKFRKSCPGFLKIDNSKSALMFSAAIVPLVLCICFAMKVNFERWRNPFCFCDYRYYEASIANPPRLEAFQKSGGFLNILRIPHGFVYYFIPHKNHFLNKFPYINVAGYENIYNFKDIHFDWRENGNPLTLHSPCLLFLALVGIFSYTRAFGLLGLLPLASFLIQVIYILGYCCNTLRYSPEFMPLLVICSISSFQIFLSLHKRSLTSGLVSCLILLFLTLVGMYSASATMLQQKLNTWGVPGPPKENIKLLFDKINHLLYDTLD